MKLKICPGLVFLFLVADDELFSIRKKHNNHFYQQLEGPAFPSRKAAIPCLAFVTAGDRVYIVGFQDGSFPALGWHITGEMGGIWDHPVKLMDGFSASLTIQQQQRFRLPR